ncbi:isopentenyl-diphosphate Delta-isomerase [Methanospirillum lacunae]|uniref:isopentenyl-diphosphate Delta-isomerase n=1 Tax=Methanospirillum lacunae TaxID=668570 RepID=A0A2V2NHC5_9EURY|nr:isopentenyl-diphosphate Delta-isomerase [Methanospirillum lacunae]PWR74733.1 isopentenyl-diphosphate delta-isomerase [Methanospirillum lacunae]
MTEMLILVDRHDTEIGYAEKMQIHREGKIHRAFSIIIYNSQGEMLLQKRASSKYHSGGLWTNACCGHPRAGEDLLSSAHRRLNEEMGFECILKPLFNFLYVAHLDNQMIEHEFDHVLIGGYDGCIHPDPNEAEDYQWISVPRIYEGIVLNPEVYTIWFVILMNKLKNHRISTKL